jgi:glutaredoxin 3
MPVITIYSTNHCPYCERAKALLKSNQIPFDEIDLSDKPDELSALKQKTGLRTVPQIFIKGELIGGFTDLLALQQSGKLQKMIES